MPFVQDNWLRDSDPVGRLVGFVGMRSRQSNKAHGGDHRATLVTPSPEILPRSLVSRTLGSRS